MNLRRIPVKPPKIFSSSIEGVPTSENFPVNVVHEVIGNVDVEIRLIQSAHTSLDAPVVHLVVHNERVQELARSGEARFDTGSRKQPPS